MTWKEVSCLLLASPILMCQTVPGLGSRARKASEKAAYFCCSGGGGQSCHGSCRSSDFGKLASPVLLCKKQTHPEKESVKNCLVVKASLKVIFSIFHRHTSFHAEGREEKRIIDFLLLILNQVSHDRRWLLFKHTRSANAGIDLPINWRLLQ